MIKLNVSVKKFDEKKDKDPLYVYSTKLYDITDTAEQNGTWYKVFFTKELKKKFEAQNVKINRPFEIEIDPDCVVYNKDEKKIFFLADKPCKITFIKTSNNQTTEETTPKFDEVFRAVKVEENKQ